MKYNNAWSVANSFLFGVGIIITYFLFFRRNLENYVRSFRNRSFFTPYKLPMTNESTEAYRQIFYLPTHKICLVLLVEQSLEVVLKVTQFTITTPD